MFLVAQILPFILTLFNHNLIWVYTDKNPYKLVSGLILKVQSEFL